MGSRSGARRDRARRDHDQLRPRHALLRAEPESRTGTRQSQTLGVENLRTRVTIEPSKCGGRPCIRGLRIRVTDILQLLVHEAPHEEILTDHPNLVRDDILAALAYAAHQTGVAPSRNS